jgi:hypothetical protein
MNARFFSLPRPLQVEVIHAPIGKAGGDRTVSFEKTGLLLSETFS